MDAVAWYRRRRPFRLFIIYIDMFSSGEGAIQCAPRHPDDRPLRSVKMEREGRGKKEGERKVIIGGPWRYACGVSLRFLINFYPIPLLNIYRAERERRPSPRVRAFTCGYTARSFVSFRDLYLSVYLFIFFHSPPRRVSPPTLEGGEVSPGQFQGCRAPPFGDFLREFN